MNSNIIYINDLLNTDGIIDQNLIFNKLHNKTNYLTEIHTLHQSIPKLWNTLLKSEASRKTKVRTTTDIYLLVAGNDSHNILILDPTTGSMTPLLGQAEGIQLPWALGWCPVSRRLYVVFWRKITTINVYKHK